MQAILEDWKSAPIDAKDRALYGFVEKVIRDSWKIAREDVDAAKAAGWSDEALYDAITVCALFKFYNTWCDANGVQPMTAEGHAMSGKRLAEHGYV